MEKGKTLHVQDDYGNDVDYSVNPYIEVESILLNSEYKEIIVNMRHWKSGEEAEYYKSLAEDDLLHATLSTYGDICKLSETRLSTKGDMLQIEEMKLGKKEERGTAFTPLYPD